MDTLCIPVAAEDQVLRLTQIDKMASIYNGATTALVLDAELMSMDVEPAQSNRFFQTVSRVMPRTHAQLACSTWMCRSWTYQEGLLPASITFQFATRAVLVGYCGPTTRNAVLAFAPQPASDAWRVIRVDSRFDTGYPRDEDSWEPAFGFCSGMYLCPNDHTLWSQQRRYHSWFAKDWNELSDRATSKPEDVPLILANTVQLQSAGLIEYDNIEDKILAILLSQKRIPLDLLFNCGPRRNNDASSKNKWAPTRIQGDYLNTSSCHELSVNLGHSYFRSARIGSCSHVHVYLMDRLLPQNAIVQLGRRPSMLFSVMKLTRTQATDRTSGSTCIILEEAPDGHVVRGACFAVASKSYSDLLDRLAAPALLARLLFQM
jgi:hypothetical protein